MTLQYNISNIDMVNRLKHKMKQGQLLSCDIMETVKVQKGDFKVRYTLS